MNWQLEQHAAKMRERAKVQRRTKPLNHVPRTADKQPRRMEVKSGARRASYLEAKREVHISMRWTELMGTAMQDADEAAERYIEAHA